MEELIKKLRRTTEWAKRSQFYAQKMATAGLTIEDVTSLESFAAFPCITSEDMRIYGKTFSAVPRTELYSLYASGGTTGKPKLMYYTEDALEGVASATSTGLSRIFPELAGNLTMLIVPADNLAAVGEYTKRALRNLNALSGAMGPTFTADQTKQLIEVMREEKPYLLIGNPARLTKLINDARAQGIDPKEFGLSFVLSTSEVLTKKARQFISESFGAQVYQGGGMTEVGWSTMEGPSANGQHILDNVYAEVIDIHTGSLIHEGIGELYLTSLVNPGYPLVRYKTEDIVRITNIPQDDIDTSRIWYKCRLSEKISYKDKEYYAYQIDDALEDVDEVTSAFSLSCSDESLVLKVETASEMQTDSTREKVRARVLSAMPDIDSIVIELVSLESLERSPRGKVKNRMVCL